MHELLLFGQVPSARYDQILNILAGVAAMQPVPVLEKHLVFKPNRLPASARPVQVGGAQDIQKSQVQALQAQNQGDLFYLQLVAEPSSTAMKGQGDQALNAKVEGSDEIMLDASEANCGLVGDIQNSAATEGDSQTWTLQYRDLPEVVQPGRRQITSRLMADIPITSGDPMQFMKALDYTHTATYLLAGHRFTHLSTSILLHRLLLPTKESQEINTVSSKDFSQARLLDPSGTYILQAAVRVQDGSKVETMTKGSLELLSLKETLKGVVELDMGDRLALDTRVR